MSELKMGWSEVSITPEKKVKLAGQFFERISEYVETPVTVTALAIESGGEQAVLCACDLVAVSSALVENVRAAIKGKIDLPPEKLIIGAIHSHTSLQYSKRSDLPSNSLKVLERCLPEDKRYVERVTEDSGVMSDDEALEFLTERIAQAVCEAWENRKGACYASGFGRAAVGMCRRVCYDDGSAKMWGDTNCANFTELEGGNDSGIELLYTFDANKKLTGIVANVACPAQVVEHRSFISSDYWGKVKEILRKRFGEEIFVLGLCSAAGDQCPRDLIRWVNPETPIDDPNIKRENYIERTADPSMFDLSGCRKVGKRIANEIIDVYDEIEKYEDSVPFVHETMRLDLPVRRVTVSEYEAAVKAIEEFIKNAGDTVNFADNAKMHVYAGTIDRYEYQQTHELQPVEIHVLRLGNIAIATNPFELFLDYGNQIRARSRARQTFLIQLCCGSAGYLPTEKAERGSHYSAYVSSGIAGHEGGALLVRKTLAEINEMWG